MWFHSKPKFASTTAPRPVLMKTSMKTLKLHFSSILFAKSQQKQLVLHTFSSYSHFQNMTIMWNFSKTRKGKKEQEMKYDCQHLMHAYWCIIFIMISCSKNYLCSILNVELTCSRRISSCVYESMCVGRIPGKQVNSGTNLAFLIKEIRRDQKFFIGCLERPFYE